jgi:hypothetical protein
MQTTDTIDIPKLRAELEAAPDWAQFSEEYNAAARGVSIHLVRQERRRGTGVPFINEGRRVLYSKRDILNYINSRPRAVPVYRAEVPA